jgi:hypothetical protein
MIEITKINEVYSHLKCDRSIARELVEYFSFFATGYKFMSSYRNKLWDGKLRLCKILPNGNLEFPLGLMKHLETFASENGYTLKYNYIEEGLNTVSRETLEKFVLGLNLHSKGKKIEIRDYQLNSVLDFLNNKRLILLSPTASGKSLILYTIVRFLLEFRCGVGLVLVPNVSLCHQLSFDFEDYSSHNGWIADDHIHTIFSGKEKTSKKPIHLSTWQSIFKNDKNFFKDFQFVVSDECFSGDMQVLCNSGYKEIKNLKVGDIVLNYSENTNEFKEDIILNIHKNISSNEKMYELTFDNEKIIKVTGNHKFLTKSGWIRADELDDSHEIISYV